MSCFMAEEGALVITERMTYTTAWSSTRIPSRSETQRSDHLYDQASLQYSPFEPPDSVVVHISIARPPLAVERSQPQGVGDDGFSGFLQVSLQSSANLRDVSDIHDNPPRFVPLPATHQFLFNHISSLKTYVMSLSLTTIHQYSQTLILTVL